MFQAVKSTGSPWPQSLAGFLALMLIGYYIAPVHAGAATEIAVLGPLQRVFESTPLPMTAQQSIRLWAARGEYESAQIGIHSSNPIRVMRVESTALRNAKSGRVIPSTAFSYAFPAMVYLRSHTSATPDSELEGVAPGWYPDPLEQKPSLRIAGTRSIWITWHVPEVPAGDYSGNVVVTIDNAVHRIPVNVHVWNFSLPRQPSLYVSLWLHIKQVEEHFKVKRGSEAFWRTIENIAADMQAHRQDVIYTPLSLIKSWPNPDGTFSFDFSEYDRWVNTFRRHDFRLFEGTHLNHFGNSYDLRKSLNSSRNMEIDSAWLQTERGRTYLSQLLPALERENRKLGIADRYLQHIIDEPKPENAQLYAFLANMVRTTMPGVPIIDAMDRDDARLASMINIPVTLIDEKRATSTTGWWYTAVVPRGEYPNRFIDYPLIKLRIIPWLCWKYDVAGYLHYGYNFWYMPSGKSPWLDVQSGSYPPGDGFIVYPPRGTNNDYRPVSSLRWEAFRDGLEDYEYLRLFQQQLQNLRRETAIGSISGSRALLLKEFEGLNNEISQAVPDVTHYMRSNDALELIRRRMGQLLDACAQG